MEKFFYPIPPFFCNITGPSECGKSGLLTDLILHFINKYDKIYIYSPSLHQDLNQKSIKCFSNYIPINIILNILKEEDIDVVIEEIDNKEDFGKSDSEIQTSGSIEDMKFLQDYDDGGNIILDDLNEKEMNDHRVQAMFKRSRHNHLSFLKRTIRAKGIIYHIIKPNIFRDVQNLYQDKTSMVMNLNEFKLLTSTCWNKNYQPLTIEMTKEKHTGCYRLGLKSTFVPDSSPF